MFKKTNIYTNAYERFVYVMGKKEKNNKKKIADDKDISTNENNNNNNNNQDIASNNLRKIIITIISSVAVLFITALANLFIRVSVLENDIAHISSDISFIIGLISEVDSAVIDTNENINRHDTVLESLLSTNNNNSSTIHVMLLPDYQIETEIVYNEIFLTSPSWEDTDIIAKNNNISYCANELYNTPILVSYNDNGKNIYFYGQYNENNHWNGRCILNIYNGDNLETIFEGIYNDGYLFSYKRLSCSDGKNWIVNIRINNTEYKSGETWIYAKTEDIINTVNDNFTQDQILTVNNFLESTKEDILSYYKGNTSNGLYNDNTGNAYYIKYFNSDVFDCDYPVIQTLYQGNFVNGKFDDDTYNAWYITRESNTTYMYYRGCYSENEVVHTVTSKEEFENYLPYNKINEILIQNGFDEYINSFYVEYKN